jgi:four helix bundle protein
MNPQELKERTKKFALRVLNLADKLPRGAKGRLLSDQIARAGALTAANYRAACKARSHAEFVSKMGVAEEEAEEVQFWLEMIGSANLIKQSRVVELHREARELTVIFAMFPKIRGARRP